MFQSHSDSYCNSATPKIACLVEGQTEQIFVERLFQEIAGYKKISIETFKFQGGKDNRIIQSLKPSIVKDAPFFVILYNCDCDSQVLSDIRKQQESLRNSGYEKFLGLRNLSPHPLEKKQEIEKGIRGFLKLLQHKGIPIPMNLAVREIEAWFLAEWNYWSKIYNRLLCDFILEKCGLDLRIIDT